MTRLATMLMLMTCCAVAQTTRPADPDNWRAVLAEMQPGDEMILADGVYGAILLPTAFVATEQTPTIIRAANRGRAMIRPKAPEALNGVCSHDQLPPTWLIVDGLDVSGASVDGIRFVGGKHVTIRNCRVHDNQNNGLALHRNADALVEGCTFDHNGNPIDPTQKHGLYASGDRITVRNCIVDHNTGWGIHLWEYASACVIVDNTCYANDGCGIVVQAVENAKPEDGNLIARNLLFGNRIGLQLSRAAYDRVIDNKIFGNAEASVTFHRDAVAPVLWSGNKLDKPAVGTSQPSED